MNQNKSYHPSVIVNDHFENIINQIDIKTESLFQDPGLDGKKIDQYNALREKQLDLIKEIREISLKNVKFDEENFQKEWSYILNDRSLDYQQKIDEIKVKLISIDCVLVKDASSKSDYSLWITNWFNKSDNLKFIE